MKEKILIKHCSSARMRSILRRHGWGCGSLVEYTLSTQAVLDSIPNTKNKTKNKQENEGVSC
jgi:hypothetical protein